MVFVVVVVVVVVVGVVVMKAFVVEVAMDGGVERRKCSGESRKMSARTGVRGSGEKKGEEER